MYGPLVTFALVRLGVPDQMSGAAPVMPVAHRAPATPAAITAQWVITLTLSGPSRESVQAYAPAVPTPGNRDFHRATGHGAATGLGTPGRTSLTDIVS